MPTFRLHSAVEAQQAETVRPAVHSQLFFASASYVPGHRGEDHNDDTGTAHEHACAGGGFPGHTVGARRKWALRSLPALPPRNTDIVTTTESKFSHVLLQRVIKFCRQLRGPSPLGPACCSTRAISLCRARVSVHVPSNARHFFKVSIAEPALSLERLLN